MQHYFTKGELLSYEFFEKEKADAGFFFLFF